MCRSCYQRRLRPAFPAEQGSLLAIQKRYANRFRLSDCGTPEVTVPLDASESYFDRDPRTGYTRLVTSKTVPAPFYDKNFNRITCLANKFPNGTVCPPPAIRR